MAVKPYMFPRHAKGKLLVPVGWNELPISKVVEGTTRNGKRMVKLYMYAKPSDEMYGYRMERRHSFRPVICVHMEGQGDIKSWYKSFSTMPNEDLDKLKTFKGKKFMALIKHVQKPLEKWGRRVVDGHDNQKYYFSPEIVKAAPLGKVDAVDKNDLLETIDYDLSMWKSESIRRLIDTLNLSFEALEYEV